MTDKTSKWETCQTTAPAVIFIYTHVPEGHNPNGISGFGIRDEPFIRPPDHRHRVWVAEDEVEDTRRVVKMEDDPDVSYTRTDLFEQVVAERDALQARIDGAPTLAVIEHAHLVSGEQITGIHDAQAFPYLAGKRIALVVLDDE